MAAIARASLVTAGMIVLSVGLAEPPAYAGPVTFSTTGVWSVSGTNVVNFTNANGTTTITFNGTTNPVSTPVGVSFGDIVITTTVPANLAGPAINGNFTLNIIQVSPAGAGSLVAALSGNIGSNTGTAFLTFSTTSLTIGGVTYTIDPIYIFALPVTGVGGGAGIGTTTLQGTVTGAFSSATITKTFGAATIPLNGTTSLSFTVANPDLALGLTNVSFTDALPAGLVVNTPNGLSGSCGGGTITAVAGSGSVSLSGAALPANTSCTFSIVVLGTTLGVKPNTTSTVTSNEASPGSPASATLTVSDSVPMLGPWNLALLAMLLLAAALYLLWIRRVVT